MLCVAIGVAGVAKAEEWTGTTHAANGAQSSCGSGAKYGFILDENTFSAGGPTKKNAFFTIQIGADGMINKNYRAAGVSGSGKKL